MSRHLKTGFRFLFSRLRRGLAFGLERRPLPRLGDVEGVCDNCCSPATLRPQVCQRCIPGNAALRALANWRIW